MLCVCVFNAYTRVLQYCSGVEWLKESEALSVFCPNVCVSH